MPALKRSAAVRGSAPPSARRAPADGLELIERFRRGDFPAMLYLEGPSESLKAALLAELRRAWARACPEAPLARVFRAAEAGIEEILAAFQGASLFSPRDLILVLEVEDLGRSEKRVAALAAGLATPGGGSCLVLHESEADAPRKSLEPLRAASSLRWVAEVPARPELLRWGHCRLADDDLDLEPGVVEAVADACEGDPLTFFNELEKLDVIAPLVDGRRRITRQAADTMLKPVLGADLPEYLSAVALGRSRVRRPGARTPAHGRRGGGHRALRPVEPGGWRTGGLGAEQGAERGARTPSHATRAGSLARRHLSRRGRLEGRPRRRGRGARAGHPGGVRVGVVRRHGGKLAARVRAPAGAGCDGRGIARERARPGWPRAASSRRASRRAA